MGAGFRQAFAQLRQEHGRQAVVAEIAVIVAIVAAAPIVWIAACLFTLLEPVR